jgi:hypothetical protein
MENELEVWRADLEGKLARVAGQTATKDVTLYVKVGQVAAKYLDGLTGRTLCVANASRKPLPIQDGDLMRTPDGRWVMFLREGIFDVGQSVREVAEGVLIDWQAPERVLGDLPPVDPKDGPPWQHRFVTPSHTIVVGWDNPLQTFFAQVWPGHDEEAWGDEPELWAGCRVAEVPTVEALAELLKPCAELPAEVVTLLRRDCERRRPTTSKPKPLELLQAYVNAASRR